MSDWGLIQCTHNVTVSYFTYQTSNIRFYTFFFVAVVFLQHNTFTSKSVVFSFGKSNMSELLGIYVGVVGVGQIGHSSKLNSRSDRKYSAAFLQSGNIQIMYRPWLDLVNG